jgi:hypothetical protein
MKRREFLALLGGAASDAKKSLLIQRFQRGALRPSVGISRLRLQLPNRTRRRPQARPVCVSLGLLVDVAGDVPISGHQYREYDHRDADWNPVGIDNNVIEYAIFKTQPVINEQHSEQERKHDKNEFQSAHDDLPATSAAASKRFVRL